MPHWNSTDKGSQGTGWPLPSIPVAAWAWEYGWIQLSVLGTCTYYWLYPAIDGDKLLILMLSLLTQRAGLADVIHETHHRQNTNKQTKPLRKVYISVPTECHTPLNLSVSLVGKALISLKVKVNSLFHWCQVLCSVWSALIVMQPLTDSSRIITCYGSICLAQSLESVFNYIILLLVTCCHEFVCFKSFIN